MKIIVSSSNTERTQLSLNVKTTTILASHSITASTASFANLAATASLLAAGGLIESASFSTNAVSSSYAHAVEFINIKHLPDGIISSSLQINTGSFDATGSFTGSFTGNGQNISGVISSSFSTTAVTASVVPFTGVSNKPTGLVSSSLQINTGSFSGSFTGSLQGTSSYAVTASYAANASAADFNTLLNKPTGLVSSSLQVNTGSFQGGFTGSLAGSASYAGTNWNAVNNKPNGLISSSLQINTGSFQGGFTGTLQGTASLAITASYAANVSPTDFNTLLNKPTGLVSSSLQINTGSFQGGFTGSLLGSASYAGTDWNAVNNKPVALVSSSLQINTGSFQGGFTGSLLGSASYALTSSFASNISPTYQPLTASYALSAGATGGGLTGNGANGKIAIFTNTTVLGTSSLVESPGLINVSASLTVTGSEIVTGNVTASAFKGDGAQITGVVSSSYTTNVQFSGVNNKPVGLVSSSLQINTGSFQGGFTGSILGSASYAGTDWNAVNNKPVGLVSSSLQLNTGSFAATGSFTGSFKGNGSLLTGLVSASYAQTASLLLGSVVSASYAVTSSYTQGLIASASYAQTAVSASYFSGSLEFPDGLIVTGSVTASVGFKGSGAGITGIISSSYAVTASYALNGGGGSSVSASYATTASVAQTSVTASYISGTIGFPNGLVVTGSVTASIGFKGDGTQVTGVVSASYAQTASLLLGTIVSASYALTSSYTQGLIASASLAQNAVTASYIQFTNIGNKPVGLVSSSLQLNTGSFQGGFTGSILGSASYANAVQFSGVNNKPVGLVSSSLQINTGSFQGGFTGSLLGSASYATTASYAKIAQNVLGSITSASYASTASLLLGSVVSASFAQTAVTASYFSGSVDFPDGLVVTGSVTASVGFKGSGAGITGIISSSYAATASLLLGSIQSASYALTASYAMNGGGGSSVSASYAVTSSFAQTAVTASYFTGSIEFPNGLVVTGSITASTFYGTASLATTASYAMNGGGSSVSASYATTASYATIAQNVLGSITSASYAVTSSYTQGLIASASYAVTAATASYFSGTIDFDNGLVVTGSVTASVGFQGSGAGITGVISSSYATNTQFSGVNNKPVGLVSSSLQINTGSFVATGSFTGSFKGDGTNIIGVISSSYATNVQFSGVNNKPVGLVSSSLQINTGSFVATGSFTGSFKGDGTNILGIVSSSYASNVQFSGVNNKPVGLLSSSLQINTGSFFGGFTGSLLGSSSYATTASYATVAQNVLGSITSASYAGTASILLGSVVSASYAQTAVSASYFSGSLEFPDGLIVTGSVTASVGFKGSGAGITGVISSSYAVTASYALNGGGGPSVSASYATTASYAQTAVTASYISGTIGFPNGLVVTGSVTSSVGFKGDGSQVTGIISASYAQTASLLLGAIVSSSYALTASYAANGGGATDWSTLANKPLGLVSSSLQINTGSFAATGSFTGSFKGDGTNISNVVSSSYAGAVQFSGVNNKPLGLVSSSLQINTGSFSGSFKGEFTGSGAQITGVVSASYAGTNWIAVNNKPLGLVSSSLQINTGSFAATGSFTGSFKGDGSQLTGLVSASYATVAQNVLGSITSASYAGTASILLGSVVSASYAQTAVTASYFTGSIEFPSGLVVTGSVTASTFYGTASLATTSSYAVTASYAMNGGGSSVSASYAETAVTASYISGTIGFPNGLVVTGSVTASVGFQGSGAGITGVVSSSYAATASYHTGNPRYTVVIDTAAARAQNFNYTSSFTIRNFDAGILQISASTDARLRIYPNTSSRDADVTRPTNIEPSSSAGLFLDAVLSQSLKVTTVTPAVLAFNLDLNTTNTLYYTITNLTASTVPVTCSILLY